MCSHPNGPRASTSSYRGRRVLIYALILPIKGYQWLISPLLGQRCRFWPSCSQYAIEALRLHGPVKGSWLAIKRLGRCHPFSNGGIDPVPERDEHKR